MVDDVDEAHGAAGVDEVVGYLLPLIMAPVCPSSKVYDRDTRLLGCRVAICIAVGLIHCVGFNSHPREDVTQVCSSWFYDVSSICEWQK